MTRPTGYPMATWSAYHAPAVGVKATVDIPAVTGIRRVLTHITANLDIAGTAQSTAVLLQIIDGGVVVWATQMIGPVNGLLGFVSPMHLASQAAGNTVSVTFSAAGVTGSFSSIAVMGYDINENN